MFTTNLTQSGKKNSKNLQFSNLLTSLNAKHDILLLLPNFEVI
jgi:hypothetical protein